LSQPRVALVSMPWATVLEPALGIAVLKASLTRTGVAARALHLNLFLLKHLRVETYRRIAGVFALNDFVFSGLFSPDPTRGQLAALDEIAQTVFQEEWHRDARFSSSRDVADLVLAIRAEAVPAYLDSCIDTVLAEAPTLVAFSCLYDQTIASLALAKRLKEAEPRLRIAFGGYAVHGETGRHLIECFPWIDYVGEGPGEAQIVTLALDSVREPRGGPGVVTRNKEELVSLPPAQFHIRDSPYPDFSDFRRDIERLAERHQVHIDFRVAPYESSRGCWWGQKSHCVFCGIDDDTLKYSFKPHDQTARELAQLFSDFSSVKQVRLVDYILPHTYFQTLLPELAKSGLGGGLSCELKANLKEHHIELLKRAGFLEFQPGIESFSTPVLRRMKKGVSGIQNALLLKLARTRGLLVHYNFLYGFPGDEVEDYERLLHVTPLLYHLDPPMSYIEVLITRFAPLQQQHVAFGGTRSPTYHPYYDVVFDERTLESFGFDLERYCYYFTKHYELSPELRRLYQLLGHQVAHWQNRYRDEAQPELTASRRDDRIHVLDTRFSHRREFSLEPLATRVYECVDTKIANPSQIRSGMAGTVSIAEIEDILDRLVRDRVVLREGNQYVGLAIPIEAPARLADVSLANAADGVDSVPFVDVEASA
jgi:ribosomal peptide maturation radical SAM protein 1